MWQRWRDGNEIISGSAGRRMAQNHPHPDRPVGLGDPSGRDGGEDVWNQRMGMLSGGDSGAERGSGCPSAGWERIAMIVPCRTCQGTGQKPEHKQKDGRCLWCGGQGKHEDVRGRVVAPDPSRVASRKG